MEKTWNEQLAELSKDLEELGKTAVTAMNDVKTVWNLGGNVIQEKISDAKGNLAVMQENFRIAGEENKSILSSTLLKAQMAIQSLVEGPKKEEDKEEEPLSTYINNHIDYIMDCYKSAALMVENAKLALLETVDAVTEYEKRYGAEAAEDSGEKPEA